MPPLKKFENLVYRRLNLLIILIEIDQINMYVMSHFIIINQQQWQYYFKGVMQSVVTG